MWRWLIAGILGAILGVGTAMSVSGGALSRANIKSGAWSTDPNVGSSTANPWVRARVARVGLLALTKAETVYFDRTTDDSGEPLREDCTYALAGGNIPTRWWSITIYGADAFLPRNTDLAGSIDATRALKDGETNWVGMLSAQKPATPTLWLSSKGAKQFSLTLRLYNPKATDLNALTNLRLPTVTKLSCETETTGGAQ